MDPHPIDPILDRLHVLLQQTEAAYTSAVAGDAESARDLFPKVNEIRLLARHLRERLELPDFVLPADEIA